MTTVTLTDLYSRLQYWQGNLLMGDGASVTTLGPRTFAYSLAAQTGFDSYQVVLQGTDFVYDGLAAVDGVITSLTISNDDGTTIIAVEGIGPDSLASDFGAFYSYAFGFTDQTGLASGSQLGNAWSLLLSGNDTINGTDDNDVHTIPGMNTGNDVYNMGAGDDWIAGRPGNDTINGGDGYDVLSFDQSTWSDGMPAIQGLSVDVAAGTVIDVYGNTDRVTGIEQFIGSLYADSFKGGAGQDSFIGLRGNDRFVGGGGSDWLHYHLDDRFGGHRGIVVALQTSAAGGHIKGTIIDGFGTIDQITDIENVSGTRFNDTFIGSRAVNHFAGGAGVDSFDGKGGSDWVDFDGTFGATLSGVKVDLSRSNGQISNDGFGNVETTLSIENILGSVHSDRIKGNARANLLNGNTGKDTLTGGGGADTFIWDDRSQAGQGDTITDFHAGGGRNQDKLQFWMDSFDGSTTLTLVNGRNATQAVGTFIYDAGIHTLFWDDDGTGSHAAQLVVTLTGVAALSAANFDLI